MATKVTLQEAIIGDSLSIPLSFKDEAGDPIDISGRTFWLTLKRNPTVSDAEADAQTTFTAPTDANSLDGNTVLYLTPTQTSALTATPYNFDIQMKTPAGILGDEIRTIMYGKIRFVQQITVSS